MDPDPIRSTATAMHLIVPGPDVVGFQKIRFPPKELLHVPDGGDILSSRAFSESYSLHV